MEIKKQNVVPDTWQSLKTFTNARIALGRTGVAMPLKEVLALKLSHTLARDAVYSLLDIDTLIISLNQFQLPAVVVKSSATDRSIYLQRPDYGRHLDIFSHKKLKEKGVTVVDVVIILADGLSATAVNEQAVPLLEKLIPLLKKLNLSIAPVILAEQARVALADSIGSLLKARLSLILIGERPGLSSPHSMGAYITYQPFPGLTDESRNCISNIQPEGLGYHEAAEKIVELIQAALQLKMSGIHLKEEKRTIDK
ncbi:MAG: ethanolamine ammonia-lyase subunit EutC [Chitinophagaceae bacterium]